MGAAGQPGIAPVPGQAGRCPRWVVVFRPVILMMDLAAKSPRSELPGARIPRPAVGCANCQGG